MPNFKNPFTPGDVIWWERRGIPVAFYYVAENDIVCGLDGILSAPLLDVVRDYRVTRASGPYRLEKAENWSAYDFGSAK